MIFECGRVLRMARRLSTSVAAAVAVADALPARHVPQALPHRRRRSDAVCHTSQHPAGGVAYLLRRVTPPFGVRERTLTPMRQCAVKEGWTTW